MDKINCHGSEPRYTDHEIVWEDREHDGLSIHQCSYCGSIHPLDLLDLFEQGAVLGGSDWKYGYPHKFYVNNIPNPEAGKTVVIGSRSKMVDGEMHSEDIYGEASKTISRKFYTRHLLDYTDHPDFERIARAIFDKQSGQYYPRVAFVDAGKGLSYLTGTGSYDEAINHELKEED